MTQEFDYDEYKAYLASDLWLFTVRPKVYEHYRGMCCFCGEKCRRMYVVHHHNYRHLYDELGHIDSVGVAHRECHHDHHYPPCSLRELDKQIKKWCRE